MGEMRDEIAEIVEAAICRGGMYQGNSERAADEIIALLRERSRWGFVDVVGAPKKSPTPSAE